MTEFLLFEDGAQRGTVSLIPSPRYTGQQLSNQVLPGNFALRLLCPIVLETRDQAIDRMIAEGRITEKQRGLVFLARWLKPDEVPGRRL